MTFPHGALLLIELDSGARLVAEKERTHGWYVAVSEADAAFEVVAKQRGASESLVGVLIGDVADKYPRSWLLEERLARRIILEFVEERQLPTAVDWVDPLEAIGNW